MREEQRTRERERERERGERGRKRKEKDPLSHVTNILLNAEHLAQTTRDL